MAQAKQGDTVRVHYTAKLGDGTVIGSTTNHEPMQFIVGEGKMIPGFEEAVVGMNPGELKTFQVPSSKAFGPHLDEMVVQVDRTQIPADWKLEVGQQLQFNQDNGDPIGVVVIDISDSKVTLDANHPLAGKDLTFDIQFMEVV